MGTERINVNFTVGKNTYQISGARWFYADKTVKKIIGGTPATEATSGATSSGIVVSGVEAKRVLVKLVLVYSTAVGTAVKNAAQVDKPKRFHFYCDPDKAEDAMLSLAKKKIFGRAVLRVYRPLKRCYY
ncbi:hypothetical protein [Adonisia turfae]|uniref:Uncharacterized protein n=1 Tax=Adonisia turfae CCMR0081 TaxID=2292702 RepID=A0A6M0RWW9_9CYAN|nr:hypothetical protein [Adonisia turfae]NEZ60343.1 hypothetical protein [Adonisia turfae CCMR0081]